MTLDDANVEPPPSRATTWGRVSTTWGRVSSSLGIMAWSGGVAGEAADDEAPPPDTATTVGGRRVFCSLPFIAWSGAPTPVGVRFAFAA